MLQIMPWGGAGVGDGGGDIGYTAYLELTHSNTSWLVGHFPSVHVHLVMHTLLLDLNEGRHTRHACGALHLRWHDNCPQWMCCVRVLQSHRGRQGGCEVILQPVCSGRGGKDEIAQRQSPCKHEPPRWIGLWIIRGVDCCGGSQQQQLGGINDDY